MKRIRLGDLLLKENLATQEDLDKASEEQKKTGKKFGNVLIDMGIIKEQLLLELLSKQLEIPYVDLNAYSINNDLIALLPETYARRYRAIVLEALEGTELLVGMADPLDINAFDAVSRILKRPVKMAVVSESALLRVIDRVPFF